jgi:hypothetical protein
MQWEVGRPKRKSAPANRLARGVFEDWPLARGLEDKGLRASHGLVLGRKTKAQPTMQNIKAKPKTSLIYLASF